MAVESDLARHVLPKNFLRPCLLLLLHESPAHGYDLRERLRPLGFSRDDPGRLYRALRGLESSGLVRSSWETSTGGPDRRKYELTPAGEERLRDAAAGCGRCTTSSTRSWAAATRARRSTRRREALDVLSRAGASACRRLALLAGSRR